MNERTNERTNECENKDCGEHLSEDIGVQ